MDNLDPLQTFLHNNVKNIQDLLNSSDKNICLWVIDMQNDFIDAPFQDTTLFNKDEEGVIRLTHNNQPDGIFIGKLKSNPYKKVEIRSEDSFKNPESQINTGRFAVNEGIQCVDDVIRYIDLLTSDEYKDRLKKVIFSRDIHTTDEKNNANHCSFKSKSDIGFIDGIGFPAHCVNGTAGCQLNSEIKKACQDLDKKFLVDDKDDKDDKTLVVMKGCSKDYDSFGAFPYDCEKGKKYSNKRQHNGCEHTCDSKNSIDKNTGSYVLDKKEQFNLSVDLNTERETIKEKIDSIGGANMIHLVCGLAGDYCVRDTAINLKFAYPESTVAVIADATRYAALYDSIIVPDFIMEGLKREEFLENTLHLKSFKDSIASKPTYFLTPPDVMLYTYSNKMLPGEGVIFTMDKQKSNLNYTKPSNDIRPIQDPINKYWCLSRYYYLLGKQMKYCSKNSEKCYKQATGFKDNVYNGKKVGRLKLKYNALDQHKLIVDENRKIHEELKEMFPPTQGGKRRRKTKKRYNKKPKRKVTKKRHHKKTKKRKVRKTKKNKTRKR
jgi:nicotinamidase-related amidase